ncbi:MAG: UDP-N-acetylmuramoyl-L-alanine--D-glutamate ligase [Chloroherpetonaceae bacterium]|nr:UDP-N-acetylmuramoyl-L-alanine--D-glutamate ligase [Chthonomonadaceae bacterium]MDW8208440.1 UDP-N-acetylmuramoyl-L-alanine--D-glutamate ligase [Chloroherpetonaceae bacterium]
MVGTEFAGQQISVIGAARSGVAAARVLMALGARVTLSDAQPAERCSAERREAALATGAQVVFGATIDTALPPGTERVITSPGVPRTAPVLQAAVARGIPVWSEIELAFRLARVPIVAVTGTNGKTTTVLLIGAMLRASEIPAVVAGNISADAIKKTLVEAAFEVQEGVIVAEVSSFQLEWVERFAPAVAVLTNITPDHLDRHASFAEYAATKARIFAAQTSRDRAIVNRDDPAARVIGEGALPGRKIWFTRKAPPGDGPCAWVEHGLLYVRLEEHTEGLPVLATNALSPALPGDHSVENVLAAVAASMAIGGKPEAIARAVRDFPGVPHRMEYVAEIRGVRFINNSMCTNVEAAVRSLQAMDRPAVVIAGGADKGLDFGPLGATLKAKARHLILIGAAADRIEATLRAQGYLAIERAGDLEQAVQKAFEIASPGEAVLLSPACASFDMFSDFEARGAAFRQIVRTLQEAQG